MTVAELMEKLKEFPPDGELGLNYRLSQRGKAVVVVRGFELDPILQIRTGSEVVEP